VGALRYGSRAVLVAVLAAALVGTPAAAGAVPSKSSRPGSAQQQNGPAKDDRKDSESQPTPEQLAAQARADELHQQLREQADDAQRAQTALADAARAAGAALERYRTAVLAQQQAQLDAANAQAALQRAEQDVEDQRRVLGRWAWRVYTDGGVLHDSPAMLTLLDGGSTNDVATAKAWLESVGDGQARALDALRDARARQEAALETASAAQQRADADAATAASARDAADAAVAEHRAALERVQQAYETTRKATDEADQQAQLLALAGAWTGGPGNTTPLGPVGDCAGGDIGAYPNGRIPTALLCPLPAAPGKYLRADAAYAFARMSRAYAAAFGHPICVTSAYRSYEDQVRVARERPGFAARPGRSNHGWGTATDLCGGIESFGTATHDWMLANAPLFGWFHPAWAEPTGTLPEPWHWEYGG
jgi:D-alanyl-D-alanine carboxypeptidase